MANARCFAGVEESPPLALTERQKRFIDNYVLLLNAAEAYRRSGYAQSDANSAGPRLLAHPEVRARIDARLRTERLTGEMELSRLLKELESAAYLDPADLIDEKTGGLKKIHDMPEHARRAIAAIENEEIGGGDSAVGMVRKIKFQDKLRAIELRAKLANLLKEKLEVSGKLSYEALVLASLAPGEK